MASDAALPNVGSLIPSIDNVFINFDDIPFGRRTCDVCGDFFSITGDLKDCPVGLPCRHVHCLACTLTWLHRNHECPECHIKYTGDIRPIHAALEREAYLCRYQGFPPSDPSQVEFLPPSGHAADRSAIEVCNGSIAVPRRSDTRGLSGESSCASVGPTTEQMEGGMKLMHLGTEQKNETPPPYPHFRSGSHTSTHEFEAEVPAQLDRETMYKQNLRKENNRRRLARYHERRAEETDSQRAKRLKKDRAYRQRFFAEETEERRATRLEKVRNRTRENRNQETRHQHERRLAEKRKEAKRGGKR